MPQYQKQTIEDLQALGISPDRLAVLEEEVPEEEVLGVLRQKKVTSGKILGLIRGDLGQPTVEGSHQLFSRKGKRNLAPRKRLFVGDGSGRK